MNESRPTRLRATTTVGRPLTFGVWFNADLRGREHPVVLDIANRLADSGGGWDSWYFSPAEAFRFADLLEQAAEARVAQLIGAFANPDNRNGKPHDWLVVEVAPAPYLHAKGLRVRLAFDDPLSREEPDSAVLWLTTPTACQTARQLRQAAANA